MRKFLTFEFLAIGRAASLIQQAIYVILEQAVALQNSVYVDIVELGRVLIVRQSASYSDEE